MTPLRVHPAAAARGDDRGGSPFPRCDVACSFGIPRGSPQLRCQPSQILSLSDGFDIYLWICLALILS